MSDKPKLEFEIDFMTKQPLPIQVGRIALGNGTEASVVRLILLPDGLHMFFEKSKFTHETAYSSQLYYELSGVGPEPEKKAQP